MHAGEHPRNVTMSSVLDDLPDSPIASSRGRNWADITLDIHAPVADYRVDTGAHDHHLVCLCMKGQGKLIQRRDGRTHESVIGAGKVIIMPAGMPSVWEGSAAMSARIRLSPAVFVAAGAELGRGGDCELRNVFEATDPCLGQLAGLMIRELDLPAHPSQRLMLDSLSMAMAAHLWRSYNAFEPRREDRAQALAPAAVRAVLDFIGDNLERSLGLAELAQVAGISQFHFARQFKQAMGYAPAAYIQAARIEWARRLIAETDHSLVEVALSVGFADQSHFTRRFRHHTGVTPGAYARDFRRGAGQVRGRDG
jgi:AraC family transcriptional regulator